MNLENMRRLAARLRSPSAEDHFDLTMYAYVLGTLPLGQEIHTCGTTMCMAGFAVAIADPKANRHKYTCYSKYRENSYHRVAAEWLEIDEATADALFSPDDGDVSYGDVTREIAADVIDHLAQTGDVVWPACVRP